ncbi:MAG: helix-turn-helix transcriptional regulator [Bacteroidota bacterium]
MHHRRLKGITQEDLAEACNLNMCTIQRIEAAEIDPKLYTLKAIAEALEVSMETFIPPFRREGQRSAYSPGFKHIGLFYLPV